MALAAAIIGLAAPATAEVRLPVQGNIADGGAPLAGPVDLIVRLFDVSDPGAPSELTCEVFTGVQLTNGTFNILLGDTTNDCGGGAAPTAIDEAFFFAPVQLEVTFGGDVFTFPIGDVPSAGVAQQCTNAQLLSGFAAADFLPHENDLRVDDDAALATALAAAEAANAGNPMVIQLAPARFAGPIVVPDFTHVRGRGAGATVIDGQVTLQSGCTLQDVTVDNRAADAQAVVVESVNFGRVELSDVVLSAPAASGSPRGLIVSQGGEDTIVVLRDSRVVASGSGQAIGVLDAVGVKLEVRDTLLEVDGPDAVGISVGVSGAPVANFTMRALGARIEIGNGAGARAGIATHAGGGLARIVSTEITLRSGGHAVAVNGGEAQIHNSQLAAATALSLPAGGLKLHACGLQAFSGTFVQPGSVAGFICTDSYNGATFSPLTAACTP